MHLLSPLAPLGGGDRRRRSRTFLDEIQFPTTFILSFSSWDAYFWRQYFTCILAHILTQAILTAMTSLYVAPCESSPLVFLITLQTKKDQKLIRREQLYKYDIFSLNILYFTNISLYFTQIYYLEMRTRGCYVLNRKNLQADHFIYNTEQSAHIENFLSL